MRKQNTYPTCATIATICTILFVQDLHAQVTISPGTLDDTFGVNGVVHGDFISGDNNIGRDVAIQDDGKLVVVGHVGAVSTSNSKIALTRFNADGSLDSSFGVGGVVVKPHAWSKGQRGLGVVIQPSGDIVVAGSASSTTQSSGLLVQYDSTGAIDLSFGPNGTGEVILGPFGEARNITLDSQGRIVVVGNDNFPSDFAVARLSSNGILDPTFSGDGYALIDFGSSYDTPYGVAIDALDRIVLAGELIPPAGGSHRDFAIARFNVDGSLDTTFANAGSLIWDSNVSDSVDQAHGSCD